MQEITPCLWYVGNAMEAAKFYTSVFKDSAITRVHHARSDTPGNREGDVLLVEFTLGGRPFQALNGGPHDTFNDAISLSVLCEDQAEVDRLWTTLTSHGGRPVQCGWIKDQYGVSWQIIPKRLMELIAIPDADKARRVMQTLMQMTKIEIAALEEVAR